MSRCKTCLWWKRDWDCLEKCNRENTPCYNKLTPEWFGCFHWDGKELERTCGDCSWKTSERWNMGTKEYDKCGHQQPQGTIRLVAKDGSCDWWHKRSEPNKGVSS